VPEGAVGITFTKGYVPDKVKLVAVAVVNGVPFP